MLMVVFLGMAGLVIDVAREHVTQRHLQTAADAAALAAAQELPGSSLSACTFSASPAGSSNCAVNSTNVSLAADGDNYATSFGDVQTTATLECLSVASAGTPCETGSACPGQYGPAGTATNTGCNAIQVTEQTSVDPFFMSVLGFGTQAVSATATASLAGGRRNRSTSRSSTTPRNRCNARSLALAARPASPARRSAAASRPMCRAAS